MAVRDRFFTPRVARAITSPLGIVLFGAGAAGAIVAGLPLAAAAGVGALAWGGRVLAAVGTGRDREGPRRVAGELSEPWRTYATEAEAAKARFDRVVESTHAGPLRDRLARLAGRLDEGVDESWRIAHRGHELVGAIGQIDTTAAEEESAELRRSIGSRAPSAAEQATADALEAQLASARRLAELAARSRDRLRLLDARFDELVARAVEVSVSGGDTTGLGDDVDGLVTELEALRVALDETDRAAGSPGFPEPGP